MIIHVIESVNCRWLKGRCVAGWCVARVVRRVGVGGKRG